MLNPDRTATFNTPVWDAQGYVLGWVRPQVKSVGVVRLTGATRAQFGTLWGGEPKQWGWLTDVPRR